MGQSRWAALCVALAAAGCGGGGNDAPPPPGPEGPAWVNQGGAAFDDANEAVYGVGSVSGVRNVALARDTSEQRARAAVERELQTTVEGMLEDYMQSITDFNLDSSEEQAIRETQRFILDGTLAGCRIVDRWQAPDGTQYALAKLSSDALAQQMRQQISQVVSQRISNNREQALDRLDDVIERRRGGANGEAPAPANPPRGR